MGLFKSKPNQEIVVPPYARECMTLGAVRVRNTRYLQEVLESLEPFKQLKFRVVDEKNKYVPTGWDFVEGSLFVLTEDHRFCGQLDQEQVQEFKLTRNVKLRGVVLAPTNGKGIVGKSMSVADLWELWLYPVGSVLERLPRA